MDRESSETGLSDDSNETENESLTPMDSDDTPGNSDESVSSSGEQTGGEDDSTSIEEMLLSVDEGGGIIRNRELLDSTHVVEEDRIVGREDHLGQITKRLRVALNGDRPPHLFLYGPSGTGKSLISKAVCNKIQEISQSRDIQFGTISVNCQNLDTLSVAVYELAQRAAEQADVDVEVPKHGVATKEKWTELYRILSENFDVVVFNLDELDMLVGRRDRDSPAYSDLLYQLSRAGSDTNVDTYISVIAISNDTKALEEVGSRAMSSFSPEDVKFDDYDANQLQSILRNRSDAFYDDVLESGVIPLASAFAAQTHGDARKAIDLMRVAGELAERNGDETITESHVENAQQQVEKNRVLEVARGISSQKKYSLYATATVADASDDGKARSPTGYELYQYLTNSIGADTYQQETYVNHMKELTTYSLVESERKSYGPKSGMFLEFEFGESPATIIETLLEDSRLADVPQDELREIAVKNIRSER